MNSNIGLNHYQLLLDIEKGTLSDDAKQALSVPNQFFTHQYQNHGRHNSMISKDQYEEIVGYRSPNALKEYSYETTKIISEAIASRHDFVYSLTMAAATHDESMFNEVLESHHALIKSRISGIHLMGTPQDQLSIYDYLEYVKSYLSKPVPNRNRMADYFKLMSDSDLISKIGGKVNFYENEDQPSNYITFYDVPLRNGRIANIFLGLHIDETVPANGYFTVTVVDKSTKNIHRKVVEKFPIPESDFKWLEEFLLAMV